MDNFKFNINDFKIEKIGTEQIEMYNGTPLKYEKKVNVYQIVYTKFPFSRENIKINNNASDLWIIKEVLKTLQSLNEMNNETKKYLSDINKTINS